jgi:hypothetical protein
MCISQTFEGSKKMACGLSTFIFLFLEEKSPTISKARKKKCEK